MDLKGSLKELQSIVLRTSGDNKEVTLSAPATLTGASSSFPLPDAATGEVVLDAATQTLTGKTIAAGSNTISGLTHGSEVDNPSSANCCRVKQPERILK